MAPAQEKGRRGRRAVEWRKTRTEDPLSLRVCMEKVSMTSILLHRHHRGLFRSQAQSCTRRHTLTLRTAVRLLRIQTRTTW